MNPSKFEELLSVSLYRTCKSTLDRIALNNPDLRESVDIEFNNFLTRVRSQIGKIYSYVQSEDPTAKPKLIAAVTTNFIFRYTIFPDYRSRMEIKTVTNHSRDYDIGFMTSKIKAHKGHVYFLWSEHGFKIGCTSKLQGRVNAFIVNLPFKTKLHSSVETKQFTKLENTLHKMLAHKRLNGEWFILEDQDFIDIDLFIGNMGLTRIIADGKEIH